MVKRCVVYVAWGDTHIHQLEKRIDESKMPDADILLITDLDTSVTSNRLKLIRKDFRLCDTHRKPEGITSIPYQYEECLFLDTDTIILGDIEFGFEKARKHGIAIAPAPHYSLDHFWDFDRVMEAENVALDGQLLYNSGVIFFMRTNPVMEVFNLWLELAAKYDGQRNDDQSLLTLAMELLEFNPYTLSINYNFRGYDQGVSGVVRLWHSSQPVPEGLNEFDQTWPLRRVTESGIIRPGKQLSMWKTILARFFMRY